MNLRYLPIKIAMALKGPFSFFTRQRRMKSFLTEMAISGGENIIDLGGTPHFWRNVETPLNLTVINLPGSVTPENMPPQHNIHFIYGDACNLSEFENGSFDIAFSNSVIEHVGGVENERKFAEEAKRLAPRYWVQTPSIWFPIEAHNHMPFWWFYPESMKSFFMKRWKEKLPAWSEMIEGTVVISKKSLVEMFPDAKIMTERFLFFPKSYIAMRK